ncbi:MAG: hypothetical protein N2D54_12530 [Chloroflexota bacterium]
MDPFEFDEPVKKPRGGAAKAFWNIGTLFFVISTLCVLGYYGYIFLNPYSPANLFRPRGVAVVPTLVDNNTPPPTEVESTIPTATTEPTATVIAITPEPTATLELLPSATPFQIDGATATSVSTGKPFFAVQPGNPTYLPHSEGCGGMYVAGNVTNLNEEPMLFMTIRLTGTLNGASIGIEDALSGTSPQYAGGGYEIQVGDGAPENTNASAFIQMLDQEGQPASDIIFFQTFDDCNKNLILVNFVQTK